MKREILRGRNDRKAIERALGDEDRVIEVGGGLGVAQPVGVAASVAEFQRIVGDGRNRRPA